MPIATQHDDIGMRAGISAVIVTLMGIVIYGGVPPRNGREAVYRTA